MRWRRQIEPELYYHAQVLEGIIEPQKELIREKALFLARDVFAEIYDDRIEIEVIVEGGSLRIRIFLTIGSLLLILSKYGEIRTGADYLYKDLKWGYGVVAEKLKETHLIGEPISIQRRIGVIGRIDRTLYDFKNGRITLEECETQLVKLFEVINESPRREELIRALLGYMEKKYKDAIPLDRLEETLYRRDALPPRRREEDQEVSEDEEVSSQRIELKNG